jgi:hypothetical protein
VISTDLAYLAPMSRKRVPHVPSKRPVPYCIRTWPPEQRIAYYTKPDPLSGCHIWHGYLTASGYGRVHYQSRLWLAHRLAWTLNHGPIPNGMILCHRCNVKRCVNPDHLVLGTRADNNADTKAAASDSPTPGQQPRRRTQPSIPALLPSESSSAESR